MKKQTYWELLTGLCWLLAVQPVSAAESRLEGKNWLNEGKLQIDLSNPQWTDEKDRHTLTILEQWGIDIFTPKSDAYVSANKEQEATQRAENKSNIFVVDTGTLNETVAKSRDRLFREPVQVNRVADYQQRKVAYQEANPTNLFLTRTLLLLAGAVLLVSALLTWKNKRKKDWKEGMSHGSHAS